MYPFFVYGTLLPDQPNFHHWGEARIEIEPAIFHSGRLYDMGAFPMLIETDIDDKNGVPITGALVTVHPDDYERVLVQLDKLEQYDPADAENSMYIRVSRPVERLTNEQPAVAWLYVGKEQFVRGMEPIGSDWVGYTQSHKPDLFSWWERYHADPDATLDANTNDTP